MGSGNIPGAGRAPAAAAAASGARPGSGMAAAASGVESEGRREPGGMKTRDRWSSQRHPLPGGGVEPPAAESLKGMQVDGGLGLKKTEAD